MKHYLLFALSLITTLALGQHNQPTNKHTHCCKAHLLTKTPGRVFDKGIPHPKMYDYDITFAFLDLEVTNQSKAVSGQVRYDAKVTSASLEQFVLSAIEELSIESVSINNQVCTFEREGEYIITNIDPPLAKDDTFTAIIQYSRPAETSLSSIRGITSGYASKYGVYVTETHSEPSYAKQWFPAKEILEDKYKCLLPHSNSGRA